jgi:hypothetical protein
MVNHQLAIRNNQKTVKVSFLPLFPGSEEPFHRAKGTRQVGIPFPEILSPLK